jgi:peroxiredoxin
MFWRIALASALAAGSAFGADTAAIDQAISQLRDAASKAPTSVAIEVQIRAAGLLRDKHASAAQEFARRSLERLSAAKGATLAPNQRKTLATLVPAETLPAEPQPAPQSAAADAKPAAPADPPEYAAIEKGIGQMRGLPTDADRARLVLDLTPRIRALPADYRLATIMDLSHRVTEGDLGAQALGSVASVMAEAIRTTDPKYVPADNYLDLASLVRYEHVPAPPTDPGLDTASAYLALRERLVEEAGFTLTGLDGNNYSLDGLRGHVVLLNFWATWCPPCRKEMPDMQKLYEKFKDKGLIVLGVSDEERATVEKYIAEHKYPFPILLDPGRKVNTSFNIEGIPQTFIFDRSGKLAAESIDMRTEAQFLKMLKQAGIE